MTVTYIPGGLIYEGGVPCLSRYLLSNYDSYWITMYINMILNACKLE